MYTIRGIRDFVKRQAWIVAAFVALLVFVVSFIPGLDASHQGRCARRASHHVADRMEMLDAYARGLLADSPSKWPEMEGVPDDMVLYRYSKDTLNFWCNLFGVMNDDISLRAQYPCMSDARSGSVFPLANAGPDPSFVNIGSRWYILKLYSRADTKVIAGLMVKDETKEEAAKGTNGANPRLHIPNKNVVTTLMNDGSTVYLDSIPLFKVTTTKSMNSEQQRADLFRLLSAFFLACAMVMWSFWKKSSRNCLITLLSLCALAVIFRITEQDISRDIPIFSPSLYADTGLLDSFGTLMFFNGVIFLMGLNVYNCRHELASSFSLRKFMAVGTLVFGAALTLSLIFYVRYSLTGVVMNSDIALEPRKLPLMDINTIAVYLSYILLMVAVFLMAESWFAIFNVLFGKNLSLRNKYAFTVFSALGAGMLCWIIIACATTKEESRISNYSNRLAMDRDLLTEVTLLGAEKEIAEDPIFKAIAGEENSLRVLENRLAELYLSKVRADYDISVLPLNMDTPAELLQHVDGRIKNATALMEHSRFMYEFDPSTGGRYFAVFTYESDNHALCGFLLNIETRIASTLSRRQGQLGSAKDALPAFYSYARYYGDKLVSFKGNFAYPMLRPTTYAHSLPSTITHDGYKHFINIINDDEVIVVSREDVNLLSDFVMFSFLVVGIFLTIFVFRIPTPKRKSGTRQFSTRMKRLMIIPLFSTLIVMAAVSVLFVGTMSERDRNNFMSSRISSVQLMLDSYCKNMYSTEEMLNVAFAENLAQTAKTSGADIFMYSLPGKLMMTSSPDLLEAKEEMGRLSPDAYRQIVLDHERFCILKQNTVLNRINMLYAPVMNADGKMLAIAGVPYMDSNKYFTRDAFFHAGTMISVFMLILFIVTLVLSSITNSIFQPLQTMGQKMKAADPNDLEPIEYKGNDEISALVQSYNDMVMTMRSSTARLAEAERNKAWSEMARQVAHEIKNPLTPIKLELQRIMRLKAKGDPSWVEKFDKASEVVLEHIDILSSTANEFSTFAKLYSEAPVEFNLDKALQDQIILFSEKQIDITYLGMEDAMFTGPKPQLIRVFFNVLSNAVQAVDGGDAPRIIVSLRRGEMKPGQKCWTISIEDNGSGVSEENKDKLFTPNFTTKSGGTGLGLAISRNVVDNCGGTITYSRSFSLGGACFSINLPVEA